MDERRTPLSAQSLGDEPEIRTQTGEVPVGEGTPGPETVKTNKKYDLSDAYAEFDNGYEENDAEDEPEEEDAPDEPAEDEPEEDLYDEEPDEYDEWEPMPRRAGKIALIVVGALIVALVGAYMVMCALAANRTTALNGTRVMGVDVSGLTRQQVEEMWEKESDRICGEMKIPLMAGGKMLDEVSVSDLGVSITAKDAADCAMQAGRTDNFLIGGWNLIRSFFGSTDSTVRLTVDDRKLDSAVDRLCAKLGGTVVEGAYRLDEEKCEGVYVTKPRDGVTVDRDALCVDIRKAISTGELDKVNCSVKTVAAQPFDLAAIYEEIHGEMANAGYDKATGGLTDERIGVEFNLEEALAMLANAEPGTEFLVPGTVEFPVVSKEELKDVLFRDCLGSYSTVANGTQNRQNNVRKAAGKVNGTILNSGENFSFNKVVGDPSQANGFYPAPAYVGGKTVDVYGGGVCQVASTLYYATLLSNLKIVDRSAHQYAPSYITFGCDATTFYPYTDYVFQNNTNYPIRIETSYTNNNTVTIKIYGTKLDDTYVRMVSSTLSSTPSTEEFIEDKTLSPGKKVVEQTGYTGYYVKTYRNVYAGDGTLISSEFEAVSNYQMRPTIYRVGPKAPEPEPEPEPQPEPEPEPQPEPGPGGGEEPGPGGGEEPGPGGGEEPDPGGDEGGDGGGGGGEETPAP